MIKHKYKIVSTQSNSNTYKCYGITPTSVFRRNFLLSFDNSFVFDYSSLRCYLIYDYVININYNSYYKLLDFTTKRVNLLKLIYDKKTRYWYMALNNNDNNNTNTIMCKLYGISQIDVVPLNHKGKKIVLLIRHAESYANVGLYEQNARITPKGTTQSELLQYRLNILNNFLKNNSEKKLTKYKDGIKKIIISPLKRTLMTAKPFIMTNTDIPIHANFLCTEITESIASVGFDRLDEFVEYSNRELEYKSPINYLNMNYEFWHNIIWKNHEEQIDFSIIKARARIFNDFLYNLDDNVVAVFTHSVFIVDFLTINYGISTEYLHNTNFFILMM